MQFQILDGKYSAKITSFDTKLVKAHLSALSSFNHSTSRSSSPSYLFNNDLDVDDLSHRHINVWNGFESWTDLLFSLSPVHQLHQQTYHYHELLHQCIVSNHHLIHQDHHHSTVWSYEINNIVMKNRLFLPSSSFPPHRFLRNIDVDKEICRRQPYEGCHRQIKRWTYLTKGTRYF